MADRSTGPVKPPVIDLTARTSSARAEAEPREASPGAAPGINHRNDAPPRRSARPDWALLGGVAAGGAVLGTVLTYLVAFALPLPSHQPDLPDLTPEFTAQSDRIGTLETTLAGLQKSTTRTQVSLDATIAQLDGGLSAVNKTIDDLKASIPAAPAPVDLGPIETEIRTLKSQLDALAAGAPGSDAGAIAQSLSTLEASVESLTTRLTGVDSTVGALRTDLDAARRALSDHISASLPDETGPALKLPLILSGLESAFASGKPFALELQGLSSILPDLAISDALRAAGPAGLTRPDTLMQRFETTLPDILAAREGSGGDWSANALDWAKSLLALRPAEEVEGDSPDAIVSRLEGAMGRRDYAGAAALIGQLPAPMQAAAAPVATDIAVHAAADQLTADIRARALAPAEPAQ